MCVSAGPVLAFPLTGSAISPIVDCTPELHMPATDPTEHCSIMPPWRWGCSQAQIDGNRRPELDHPVLDRLATNLDLSLWHQGFDMPDAEDESKIQAHRLHDQCSREPILLATDRIHLASEHKALTGFNLSLVRPRSLIGLVCDLS